MKAPHLCTERGCTNPRRKRSQKRAGFEKYCPKHLTTHWREKNPVRASFIAHKHNAKRRGHSWELTFEEFQEFAVEVDLIKKAGRLRQSYHIDRIDPTKGYTRDNIQALTNVANVQKMHKDKKIYQHDVPRGTGKFVHHPAFVPDPDAPF